MYSSDPVLTCTHTVHTHRVRVFSRQTSESGPSELNFHVVSGPGELVYRAKNQSRSFNYHLSVASECVATSLNGKQDEASACIEGRERTQQAAVTLFMQRFESFLSGCCCLSRSPLCKCEICSDLRNKAKIHYDVFL